jgi:hypothetical protein
MPCAEPRRLVLHSHADIARPAGGRGMSRGEIFFVDAMHFVDMRP